MKQLPSDAWESILSMLPVSALQHVALLPEVEVQRALPKVQLYHILNRRLGVGKRWLLRLGENHAKEDFHLSGWEVERPCKQASLWLKKSTVSHQRHGMFLLPILCARPDSLDLQAAALLALWTPSEIAEEQREERKQHNLGKFLGAMVSRSAPAVARLISWLEPDVGSGISVLGDCFDERSLAEILDVGTGQLLEIFAISGVSVDKLIAPVMLLARSGAWARGQHILAALRRMPSDPHLRALWQRSWQIVATSQVTRCLAKFHDRSADKKRRHPSFDFDIFDMNKYVQNDDPNGELWVSALAAFATGIDEDAVTRFLPKFIRGIPVLFYDGDGHYRVDNSQLRSELSGVHFRRSKCNLDRDDGESAFVRFGQRVKGTDEGNDWISVQFKPIRANLNHVLLDGMKQIFPRAPDHKERFREYLWKAIQIECLCAANSCTSPDINRLTAWLEEGVAFSDQQAWLGLNDGKDKITPLEALGRSAGDPMLFLDSVLLLVRYGDFPGPGGCTTQEVIEVALQKTPSEEHARLLWENAWKAAAANRLTWTLENVDLFYDGLLEEALDVALYANLEGRDVEEARRRTAANRAKKQGHRNTHTSRNLQSG